MGNCASPLKNKEGQRILTTNGSRGAARDTAKVVQVGFDEQGLGKVLEFEEATTASRVTSMNPKLFLCTTESMQLDMAVLRMAEEEELQPGHIYFLLPIRFSRSPLSLPDLCHIAIKASALLSALPLPTSSRCTAPRLDRAPTPKARAKQRAIKSS